MGNLEVYVASCVCVAPGIYVCSKCDHQLFSSRSKYEHSSPWPAFTETIHENSVSKYEERPGAYKVPSRRAEGQYTRFKYAELEWCLWCVPAVTVWEMWEWPGTRVRERRALQGPVSFLNIQQLTEVHSQRSDSQSQKAGIDFCVVDCELIPSTLLHR